MGLFDKKDKKRKDDFDSPVDRVDLTPTPTPPSASTKAVEPPGATPAATASSTPATPAAAAPAKPAAAPAPAAPARSAAPEPDADDYGIDKAIELMRTLPSDNIELVVQVVKFSLESVGIQLPTIIQDAIRRQNDLQGRVTTLKSEIAELNVLRASTWTTPWMLRITGTWGRFAHSRAWRWMLKDKAAAAASARTVLDWSFSRVVVCHGDIVEEDAHRRTADVLRPMLGG